MGVQQFVERTAAMQKWQAPGDFAEGILVAIDKVNYADGIGTVYTLVDGNNVVRFKGTADIDGKIFVTDIGQTMRVTYTGENKAITRNGNAMKTFQVEFAQLRAAVAAAAAGVSNPHGITDADIPF